MLDGQEVGPITFGGLYVADDLPEFPLTKGVYRLRVVSKDKAVFVDHEGKEVASFRSFKLERLQEPVDKLITELEAGDWYIKIRINFWFIQIEACFGSTNC